MNALLNHHAGNSELERIASVLDDLPAVLWQAKGEPGTPAFRMEYVSRFAQVLLGYPIDRWINEPEFWIQIVHRGDCAYVIEEMRGVYRGRPTSAKEFRWRTADGRFLWAEAQTTVLMDAEGHSCGLRGVVMDATARKNAELLQTAVLQSLQEQVAVIDQDGTILDVNETWRLQASERGIDPKFRWEGCNYLATCRPQATKDCNGSASTTWVGIDAVLRGARTFYKEEYSCQTAARTWWYEMTVVPLRRSAGGAIISHRDITARKDAEAAAQSMREQLAHATRVHALSELSGALGHELNQPLAAILCSAEAGERYLARGTNVTGELQELLAAIVAQSVRGGEIISRVLAMHRKKDSAFEALSINEVTAEMLRLLKSDLVTRNISVLTDPAADLPLICGDRVQLQQVLLNLILNGCDAMEANEIANRVLRIRTCATDEGWVELSVSDLGHGIEKKLLPHVCSPFVTTKAGGLGLGLSICRTIAEAHLGTLQVANNPERGVTARLCLPARENFRGLSHPATSL